MSAIHELLAKYEAEHAFARLVTFPEEDRRRYVSMEWQGGYRWFRSPNVVCLEKARRVAARLSAEGERGEPSPGSPSTRPAA